MNERMIELYKEAAEFAYKICKDEGRTGGPADHIWNTVSTGKFAELIVKECMQTCEQVADQADKKAKSKFVTDAGRMLHEGMWGGAKNCSALIKNHFGVEE